MVNLNDHPPMKPKALTPGTLSLDSRRFLAKWVLAHRRRGLTWRAAFAEAQERYGIRLNRSTFCHMARSVNVTIPILPYGKSVVRGQGLTQARKSPQEPQPLPPKQISRIARWLMAAGVLA